MQGRVNDDLIIEEGHILGGPYRNFSGREDKYNRAGQRNFCVYIDDPVKAQELMDDGWNIRMQAPRDEGGEPRYYIQVAVNFKNYAPRIILVTRRTQTPLDEESVSALDFADIKYADIVIRPYNWIMQPGTKNEKSGVKAYLKTMYVTIEEDEFADKYARAEYPQD